MAEEEDGEDEEWRLSIPRLTSKEEVDAIEDDANTHITCTMWCCYTASNSNYQPIRLKINSVIDQIEYAKSSLRSYEGCGVMAV